MNRHPLQPITRQHVDDYQRDGVICLRGMFDAEWIDLLRKASASVIDNPEEWGFPGPSHGNMTSIANLWQKPGPFRDFALNSPVGEIVGKVIGSRRIQMFHDHLFHKPAQSPQVMKWHADHIWPFRGEMVPNIWTALTPVTAENGRIEFLAGYHHHCVENSVRYGPAGDGERCPDFEEHRADPDFPFRFVSWDLEPGDAVLFHVDIPHFSKGNSSLADPRTGLAVRVIGDDATWLPKPGLAPVIGLDTTAMPEGTHPEPSPYLPTIWEDALAGVA
jgi:ectoine hydroxylase-related dioxygenase (phytanoyl-CoA dioxygenase family)